jgi:uncharacterized caspase-like protein
MTRYFRCLSIGIAVVLALDLASCAALAAEKRIALVIGNSAYRNVARLPNPEKDATAMAKLFRDAGFNTVIEANNVGNLDFKRAIRKFEDAAADADIAVVFYAGHGVEVGGINYLVPVDAKLASDRDAEDEAITLNRLVESVDGAKRLHLIILDACRDDPFVANMKRGRRTVMRGVASGLGKVEPASSDTLIAYAAKAGSTAEDGDGAHSPFTTALLANLAIPGLDVRLAFGRVRDQVMKITNNRQEPFVYGSLGGNTVALVPAPVIAKPVAPPIENTGRDYEFAAQIGTKRAWDAFLSAHSTGFYADLARAQSDKLNTAEEASRKAETAKRQAEEQVELKSEEFKRQLSKQGARQAEELKLKYSEQAKRELDEARRQAAEKTEREVAAARRQVEEAKRQAEEARRRLDDAKRQVVDDARQQILKAKRETEEQTKIALAKLPETPPASQPAPDVRIPTIDSADIARLLQAHLKRVGCDPDTLDGKWNETSRSALERFNINARTHFDVKVASLDALDAVRAKTGRVCPLMCAKGQRVEGDQCIQITCESGQILDADGACHKRPSPTGKRVARHERRSPGAAAPGGGGKCFTFNGKRFCE